MFKKATHNDAAPPASSYGTGRPRLHQETRPPGGPDHTKQDT
jgi:hypothetical protein